MTDFNYKWFSSPILGHGWDYDDVCLSKMMKGKQLSCDRDSWVIDKL